MKNRYFAFDKDAGDCEYFETCEQAVKWVNEAIDTYHDEGVGECAMEHGVGWGEIKQGTVWEITDKKSNYGPEDEWPYDSDFDEVGKLRLEDVSVEGRRETAVNRRCLKKGHRRKQRTFQIYRQPSEGYRCVADRCKRTEEYCARCGEVFSANDVVLFSYNEITLPQNMNDLLFGKGWVRAR